jgi:ribosomal protein S18 acetylase RimI-like enzyme
MDPSETGRIAEIDRSEQVTLHYKRLNDEWIEEAVDWDVPRWHDGEGAYSVREKIEKCRTELERGGAMIGAFEGEALAGYAVPRRDLAEGIAQLASLSVSREYRRRGIARRLLEEVSRLAKESGAANLYVSATPSGSAIGFYRSQGFKPTPDVNPELFALEPEDIHMIKRFESEKTPDKDER